MPFDAHVYATPRTPRGRGRSSGALHVLRPVDLLAGVLRHLEAHEGVPTAEVDDVVVGCVTQTGEQGTCVARLATLAAQWDLDAPGVTLNRFCGSGLEAINHAAAMVASGFHRLVVAGGVESMSRTPMGSDVGAMFDPRAQWTHGSVPQGISADLLATLHDVSRQEADAWAVESQRRAAEAEARQAFRSRIPVTDDAGLVVLDRDEHPRPQTTAEDLAQLTPSFEAMGVKMGLGHLARRWFPDVGDLRHIHHAGNSSGIVDGAAATVIAQREVGDALGWTPRARIRGVGLAGTDPVTMLAGPMPATRKALRQAGMSVGDIDLFEVNEAFAVVPILFCRDLGVNPDRVNVHGGAIALGHPLGATGSMLVGTAIDAMETLDKQTAVVTLCIGGGMGIATVLERVS